MHHRNDRRMADQMTTTTEHVRAIEKVHGSRVTSSITTFTGDIFYICENGETGTWNTRAAPEVTA